MKNSNTKEVIAKVQNHIIRMYGGKRALWRYISYKKSTGDFSPSTESVLREMLRYGYFLKDEKKMYNFLHRLGYTKAQLEKMNVRERYVELIVRDGTRLYEQYSREMRV